ncbi:MAG: hypothetical protein M3165_01655 [Actinomycetota bacterium]|nr:hypothetical protein [Actinomycetota bacterium]
MTGPDEDLHAVADLATCPWAYPGTPAACSGVVEGGRFTATPPAELLDTDAARTAVVAVGSNASPAVLHRKLALHEVCGPVPLLTATLTGCAVGHSAHVSGPGFVAAAPYVARAAATAVWVTLLDAAQLRCLDATEPNYVRRRVRDGVCVVELDGGTRPASFDLYDGRWGVLAPPGGAVMPFGSQEALHALLRARWPPYAELLDAAAADRRRGDAGVRDADGGRARLEGVMRLLATDEALRRRVREAIAASGWSRPSGLSRWPAV